MKDEASIPTWLDLVDAYAHYDSARLALREGPKEKLAALLCMLTLTYPRRTAIGLQSSKDVVLLQPDCFCAHDAMCDSFGVSTQHLSTMAGQEALQDLVVTKMRGLDGIPGSLKDQLGSSGIMQAAELFDKAGASESDQGEPSLGAIARMIRETRFVQVFRRIYFLRMMLSVPTGDYWNEVRQDVAGHRYRGYLEIFGPPAPDNLAKFQQFADQLDLTDIEMTERPMNEALFRLQRPKAQAVWTMAAAHEDETAEIAITLSGSAEQNKLGIARSILKVSPFHRAVRQGPTR